MANRLEQLKNRRTALGLRQKDMLLRVGISRQQYQQLESKGNPRLDTLELIAKGLKSELMLIPQEKLAAVKVLLESNGDDIDFANKQDKPVIADNPWKDILEDNE